MNRLPIVIVNQNTLWLKDISLRQTSKPVDVSNSEELASAQKVIAEMFRTLYADPSSVALAAPQIGIQLQIAVISYQDKDGDKPYLMALINPEITVLSQEVIEDKEICLSVPNLTAKIPRAKSISVKAFDQHGKPIEFIAEDFFARVIQHETDHLHGTLYIDKMVGQLEEVPDFPERRAEPALRKLGLKKSKK